MKPLLLIVDDDEAIRSQMRWALAGEYEILEAGDRSSALQIVGVDRPLVVLLDLGLPPTPREAIEGLQTLQEILGVDQRIKVIMITGNTERENALKAIDLGAFDFFSKPPVMDEVRVVVKRAFRMEELERENLRLRQQDQGGLEGLLGNSPPMERIFHTIRKVATVDVPVLILGESGTGKELVARAIHLLSSRREGPFVVINCGAIPENLLESELFGHEKGAFTGAGVRRKGKIEYADGGTLFLDEIGELDLPLQVKLLRFLQEHVIERVGGREPIQLDIRVLAATNRNLREAVEENKFREDLFYRLEVVNVCLPPLRERGNDIHLLSKSFLQKYSKEFNKKVRGFREDAVRALMEYSWPGNIREMENRIKRAVVMSDGEWLTPGELDLPLAPTGSPASLQTLTLRTARDEMEKQLIEEALLRNQGHITNAAKELDISRQTLGEMIKRYGLSVSSQK